MLFDVRPTIQTIDILLVTTSINQHVQTIAGTQTIYVPTIHVPQLTQIFSKYSYLGFVFDSHLYILLNHEN